MSAQILATCCDTLDDAERAAIAEIVRAARSLIGEPVMFQDCHECPRPGYFHGKACWVFQEQDGREQSEVQA